MSSLDDQRHLLFFVPNYDGSGSSSTGSPLSYIKLGSAKEHEDLDTEAKRGDDLLSDAGLSSDSHSAFFIDDGRGQDCSEKTDDHSAFSGHTHYDSAHDDEECLKLHVDEPETTYYRSTAKGTFTSDDSKTELSAELLGNDSHEEGEEATDPRGGWRDHTDGNRITTVRGDRVDVVVGNYKRVVFGRVSGDHVGASSYEVSGGHIFDRTSTGTIETYAIEHVEEKDVDGNTYWKIVERAHHATSVERWSGTLEEHHNGPVRILTIGVDHESTTENPEIHTTRNVGADECAITADSYSFHAEIQKYSDEIDAAHAWTTERIEATTYTKARGKLDSRNLTFKQELWADLLFEVDVFAARADMKVGGAFFDDEIDEMKVSAGATIDLHLGPRLKFHYGTDFRVHFAPVLKATYGAGLEVDIGFYGQASFFYWSYAPVKEEAHIFRHAVEWVHAANRVGDSKALGLLFHM